MIRIELSDMDRLLMAGWPDFRHWDDGIWALMIDDADVASELLPPYITQDPDLVWC
jgi:hypothetical protein